MAKEINNMNNENNTGCSTLVSDLLSFAMSEGFSKVIKIEDGDICLLFDLVMVDKRGHDFIETIIMNAVENGFDTVHIKDIFADEGVKKAFISKQRGNREAELLSKLRKYLPSDIAHTLVLYDSIAIHNIAEMDCDDMPDWAKLDADSDRHVVGVLDSMDQLLSCDFQYNHTVGESDTATDEKTESKTEDKTEPKKLYTLDEYRNRQFRCYANKLVHGFNVTDFQKEARFILKELSELMEAIEHNDVDNIIEELGDILIFCYGIAEMSHKDLDEQVFKKMAINEQRVYKRNQLGDFIRQDD